MLDYKTLWRARRAELGSVRLGADGLNLSLVRFRLRFFFYGLASSDSKKCAALQASLPVLAASDTDNELHTESETDLAC